MTSTRWGGRGFSALELLVIIAIVCVVVAIGVPTLHARAKTSVLDVNQGSLGSMVSELVLEGYSSEYRSSGEGDPGVYLSTYLEQSLVAMSEAGFVNPIVGSEGGRVVLNSSAIPRKVPSTPPAVFITDSPLCGYLSFNGLPLTTRRLLAGTLIIAFSSENRTVDVFFADNDGSRSVDVITVPMG
jgi:type II secretory pathway pseudopilin PulG